MHNVLVGDLNTDLAALFEWFPFPSRDIPYTMHTSSVETSTAVHKHTTHNQPTKDTVSMPSSGNPKEVFDFSRVHSDNNKFLLLFKSREPSFAPVGSVGTSDNARGGSRVIASSGGGHGGGSGIKRSISQLTTASDEAK